MSATINHTNILHHARNGQWRSMEALVAAVATAHTRQAFYVLCKEGRARAIEQLMPHFDNDHKFVCECIVGGLNHNITVEALDVLDPIVRQQFIVEPEVLEACFKRNSGSIDSLAQRIISWYDPQTLQQFKLPIYLSLRRTIMQGEDKAFMEIIQHWDFTDPRFCGHVVRGTLENLPEQTEQVFDVIGEKNLRNLEKYLDKFDDILNTAALHDYFSVQQHNRLNKTIKSNCNTTKSRKI